MKRILLLFGILSCWISNAQVVAPVTETFNGTALPAGWNLSATSGGPWLFQNNANSANCPVPSDHTGTAGNYAWMDQSGGDATVIMEMDTVDISALTVPYLEFYYWMCGTGYSPPNTTEVQAWDGAAWQRVALLSAATEGWEKQGMDLTTFIYNTDRVLIRFIAESGGHTSDFFGDNSLDDISVLDAPPCPRPANLGTANVLTTSADLTWRGATGNLTYDVIWGATGFDPNTQGTTVNTAASPYALTSLTGNTAYDYYLVADCGTTNGQADTLGPVSFRTACVAEAIGYFNGFEADVVNSTPLCWTGFQTRVNSNTNVVTISGPYAGVNHANLSSSSAVVNTDTIMLMSPQLLGLTSGNNQVRFFSQADNTGNTMIVGTVSNPSNPGSFTAIDTVRYSATFTYEEIIIPISVANGYNGTDEYVAFKHGNTQTFTEVYIDDFNYEVIPPCPKITAASVTGVTGTTVTLGFSTSGTSTGYEWGPVGFAQGTGTTGASSGNPITITGLAASTSYDIYIRNDCSGSGNGTSIWTGPITFTTLCAVLPAPYVQDFESSAVGHWDGIEQCWAYTGNNPGTSASGGYSWEVRNTSQVTSGTGTGPDRDNTLAPAVGGKFITADVSGSVTGGPDSTMVTSPLVDVVGLTVPQLSFYYHKHGGSALMPDINVDVWDGAWHRNAMVISGVTQLSQSEPYLKGILDLSAFGDTVLVRFRLLTGGCCTGDVAIDDIRIGEAPTCDIPTLLNLVSRTSSTGVINWVAGGSQVATNIEYGPSGFTPGTGMTIVSSDTIDTIPGLTSNTTYDVYIYDSCGAGNGNSLLVGPLTFATKCLITPTTLPWNDGFENYSVGPYLTETDFCSPTYIWEFSPTATNGRLRVAAGATYPKTGINAFTLDKSAFSAPATANFLTLNIDLSNYTTSAGIELGFSVLESLQEANPDNRVWVRGGNGDPWIEIVDLDQLTVSGTYVDISNVDIIAPLTSAGQTVGAETQIRFGQAGTTTSNSITCCDGFTFDDISLTEITCPKPSAIGLSGLTSTSAYLSWAASNNSANYQVWYGPSGFYQGSQTIGGTLALTPDSLLISTFTPQTCYEYVVRSICGPGDSSAWVGPFNFCTFCTSQMSGTYTIDASLPASATNFTSFTAASVQLNDCGVSGPVTINVAAGTYVDHIYLSNIAGASSVNTVIFDGTNSSSVTLTYSSTSDTATVYLNDADWITITNMTIINTSASDAWGVMLQNGADHNTIDNCHFDMPITTTFDVIAIVATANLAFATSAGNNANDLTISNCLFTGAEAGIQLRGGLNNAVHNTGIKILNNVFRHNDDHGIELDGLTDVIIDGNDIDSLRNLQGDGMFLVDINDFEITNNRVNSPDWSLYLNDGNDLSNATQRSIIANNMVTSSSDYAMYIQDYEETDIFHNSAEGNPGIRINDQVNTDIRNNIFVSSADFAFESDDVLAAGDVVNYNVYNSNGANPFDISVNVYADLAAWQTADATRNVNSVEGDPVFLTSGSDLHVLGSLADDVGDNAVGVVEDIDGDIRSITTPDIGADEYTAVSGDLSFIDGGFVKLNPCLSATDTIEFMIQNIIGPAVDFSVNSLSITYNVSGPVNTAGTYVQSTGTLNPQDTLTARVFTIDMSLPGSYTLNAYISANPDNTLGVNDTLASITIDIDSILTVTPKTAFIINNIDSVEITANSPFFPGGAFFVSEVMHFRTATGSPTGGWPAWHTTSVDEHVEITGVPNSDLSGITFEQWNVGGAAPTGSITFPAGTVLSPNGTAVISMQASAGSSPTDFFYDGSGGNTINWQSGGGQGIILKDAGGNIIDAVGYPGGATPYVFPAASGVTATDWSGSIGAASGTCGIRLTGADINNGSNWVVSSATNPQDPNTVNTGVTPPAGGTVSGFQWLLNGSQVSVDPQFYGGPYAASGTYQYIAELIKCGTTYTDTVTVTVVIPTCPTPATISASALSTSSASVVFDTVGFASTATFVVEYGPAGFNVGSGTKVALNNVNSAILNGLTQNLCQDVYMRVVCLPGDTSFAVGPTQMCPMEVPCDDMDAYATGSNFSQSALFVPWQNGGAAAWGDAEFSTTQAQSGANSLRMTDIGAAGVSDFVAYFDTINTGAWEITFDMYIPTTSGGYFNIQQNHALNGVGNLWNAELYFQANGSCQIQHSAAATVVGSFTYTQGQWGEMKTIIDIANDSIWFEWNGTSTGLGYNYSDANTGQPLQFNGVNFFSGPLAGSTYSIDMYIDNFCVTPYSASSFCADPTNLVVNIIRCDSVDLSWNSAANVISSDIEWGVQGFNLGLGTPVNGVTNTHLLSGLSVGTSYDFYVRDICTADTSAWVGPFNFNTGTLGAPVAAMGIPTSGIPNATFVTGFFDASGSTGFGNTYFWRFGDGSTGTGINPSHDYTTNNSWTITLIVTNACGVDSVTTPLGFTSQGIGLDENVISRSLQIFPNPTKDKVNLRFDTPSSSDATIQILDLSGKELMRIEAGQLNGSYSGTVDLARLAKGIYMIQITSGDINTTRRLIKH